MSAEKQEKIAQDAERRKAKRGNRRRFAWYDEDISITKIPEKGK